MAHIHNLGLKYQNGIHQTELVSRDEEARRLKLRVLSLRDENAMIKDKLLQKDARITSSSKQGDQVRAKLDDAKETARSQEARLKKQAMEINNLKVGYLWRGYFAVTQMLTSTRPRLRRSTIRCKTLAKPSRKSSL